MIRWPDGPTSSDADSTFRIGRKKADEDQLQPTVRDTLRKLSRLTNKNCQTADRRLVGVQSTEICFESNHRFEVISPSYCGAEEDELSDYQHKLWHKNNQSCTEAAALSHQRETTENGRISTMPN
ncbi:hypothetical protein DPX16_17615 [Anabarilius grahami]|uniref:Uncharacterized protein n=1 Tax=Anabarilius grahami TaxID=495550 RepID=A0A3N0Y0J0_ANAGA|nr:hypothetical protein DPX16_17615 [Anabarilius grahami]